jgi:hypothetical protein
MPYETNMTTIEVTDDQSLIDDDGTPLPNDAAAELAVLDEGPTSEPAGPSEDEERERLAAELASTEAALDAERSATSAALARYREALLAAEQELPPDLVQGETLEELDESVAAARSAVARIRDRLQAESAGASASDVGFPVGAPARGGVSHEGLTSHEKIAAGLRDR